jgi:hypothetical protein
MEDGLQKEICIVQQANATLMSQYQRGLAIAFSFLVLLLLPTACLVAKGHICDMGGAIAY